MPRQEQTSKREQLEYLGDEWLGANNLNGSPTVIDEKKRLFILNGIIVAYINHVLVYLHSSKKDLGR